MRVGAFLLAALWFAGSVYVGYRLTERSFAWIGELGAFPPPVVVTKEEAFVIDFEDLKDRTPEELKAMAKDLSPQQLLCLRAMIAPDRISAVLVGDITPQEAEAAKKCLE